MALPIRRRGNGSGTGMPSLDPFHDFENMWDQMGRFLEQAAMPAAGSGAWLPMAEEEESEDHYTVKLELPGYPKENIDIEVEGDELVISGELSEEHHGKVLTRRKGSFMYRTTVPAGADSEHCQADLDNGVLTVTVPKTAQLQRRRKIEIGQGRVGEGKGPDEISAESGVTAAEARNTFEEVRGPEPAAGAAEASGTGVPGAPGAPDTGAPGGASTGTRPGSGM